MKTREREGCNGGSDFSGPIKKSYFYVFVLIGMTILILRHLHLSVLVRATDGEEPLQGDAEHDVDAGHETEG